MTDTLNDLQSVLRQIPRRIVACSGGIDSLLLATIAHRANPDGTVIAHDVTPAVPAAATARLLEQGRAEQWTTKLVSSAEFDDVLYLANPRNRCYFCKSHLYDSLGELAQKLGDHNGWVVVSGANIDDLKEFRPGLQAASEHGVRHPYIEAGLGKQDIRELAAALGQSYSQLPASPCLASRLYTGTEVTVRRLRAVEIGEALLSRLTGIDVVRCRLRGNNVLVEVPAAARAAVTPAILKEISEAMTSIDPHLRPAVLDDRPYRPGRALELIT